MYSVNKGPVYLFRNVEGMITRCFQPQSLPAPTLPPTPPTPPPPFSTGLCKTIIMDNYSNDYYFLLLIYSRMHSKLLDYQMKTWSKFFLTIYIRICTLRTLKSFYRLMKRTLWRYPEQLVLWWTPCTTSKPLEECYTRWTPTQGDLRVTEYFIFILVSTIFQHHHLINTSFLPFGKEPTYLENNGFSKVIP